MDLFSGAGGMSLGVIKGGFDVIAALDHDPACIQTYLVNLGAYPVEMIFIEETDRERMEKYLSKQLNKMLAKKNVTIDREDLYRCGGMMSGSNRHMAAPEFDGVKYMFVGDARKITGEFILKTIGLEYGELDLVCGGPPCQGFSTSNSKRHVMDPRNSLVLDFARLVVEMKPKTVVFENVPGILDMVTPEGIPVIDAICKVLSDGNYGEYDALVKSITGTAGCGAALKGTHGTRKSVKKEDSDAEETDEVQGVLF